ncbi:unnamed protein product [Ambrosiozyma monospora]|uniref:Unnamed protein product n=1 Tax=Ambrosiozyma monospora TaxID=43982 RepID=A0ACB5SRM8_AMBMO|nr:unnamed protein product [Ambrosiozyma monospora]
MKITLNRCYAVYSWHWDVEDDEMCGICRVSFDGTCPACKYPGDQCPLVIGECQHAFHMHCIWKWLETETAKGLCPMCRQPFNMDSDKKVNKGIKIPSTAAYREHGVVNEVSDLIQENQENDDSFSIQDPQMGQTSRVVSTASGGLNLSSETFEQH